MKIESNSFSIETQGIGWCFARFGQHELFINAPEIILSTPKKDYWLFLDSKPVKWALFGAASLVVAGGLSMLMNMAG